MKTLEEKIELAEKERRSKNIILYNIPESEAEAADERIKEDCNKIKDILEIKKLKLCPQKIENIFRLGRKDDIATKGRPRPILLKFDTLEYKKEVLSYCKDLYLIIESVKTPIYYSLDLTLKERTERKALVEELKERKKTGEINLTIRNSKNVTLIKSPFPSEARPSQRRSWAELFK